MKRLMIREASAGTGKTHQIQEDVIAFINEGIRPERILVVTFTEKATAELRTKLRATLAKKQSESKAVREALSQFDRLAIQTIHGFCNQILGSFAFEMGVSLRSSLVDDRFLREKVLREMVRRWPGRFGANLATVLRLSAYPGFNRHYDASTWERTVALISSLYREGDRILPEDTPSLTAESIREWDTSARRLAGEAQNLLRITALKTEQAALSDLIQDAHDLVLFKSSCDRCATKLQKSKHQELQNFASRCSDLARALDLASYSLQRHSIFEVLEAVRAHKEERSLVSYDDMLERVRSSLNDAVVQQMRDRYDAAVVDEFQDTDPVQWEVFRRIFLESSDKFFYVVGDPKQAIYGFRGANVHTYFAAAREIERIGGHESRSTLDVSHRSRKQLMDALNELFEAEEWFGADYHRVKAKQLDPAPDPLVFVDVQGLKSALANARFANHIAAEIQNLVAGGRKYDDFCVLVKAGKDARAVERALRDCAIPHAYYKKAGVYQSTEAYEWLLMLTAASTLSITDIKKALLTHFFAVHPESLIGAAEIPEQVLTLFRGWNALAAEGKMSRLLRSMMTETAALLPENAERVHETQISPVDVYVRRRANLEHIAQDIEKMARGSTLFAVLEELRARIQNQTEMEENSDLHREESDRDRVRIMTIHASKGLDFDCVFVTGGFMEGPSPPFLDFFEGRGQGERVFDLAGVRTAEYNAARLEEYKRLYYVAFTRARYRVVAPLYRHVRGSPGPLVKIVRPAAERLVAKGLARVVAPRRPEPVSTRPGTREGSVLRAAMTRYPEVSSRSRGLTSYTGILRRASALDALRAQFGETGPADDEPLPPPETREAELDARGNFLMVSEPVLPRGDRTGNAIHAALDGLEFSEFDRKQPPKPAQLSLETLNHIQRSLIEYGLEGEDMLRAALHMIHAALNAELPGVGRLCRTRDRMSEFRFLARASGFSGGADLLVQDGYIHGALDLVFRIKNTYYILDWKTNSLPSYDETSLAESILKERYDLQYAVYGHALVSWLKSNGKFQPDHFGGVFYLYLRGVRPGLGEGVYRVRPDPAVLEDLPGIVARFARGEPVV